MNEGADAKGQERVIAAEQRTLGGRMPRQLVVREGRLVEKQPQVHTCSPRVIDYRHTIRVITPFCCDHDDVLANMHRTHQQQLRAKDEQL